MYSPQAISPISHYRYTIATMCLSPNFPARYALGKTDPALGNAVECPILLSLTSTPDVFIVIFLCPIPFQVMCSAFFFNNQKERNNRIARENGMRKKNRMNFHRQRSTLLRNELTTNGEERVSKICCSLRAHESKIESVHH